MELCELLTYSATYANYFALEPLIQIHFFLTMGKSEESLLNRSTRL